MKFENFDPNVQESKENDGGYRKALAREPIFSNDPALVSELYHLEKDPEVVLDMVEMLRKMSGYLDKADVHESTTEDVFGANDKFGFSKEGSDASVFLKKELPELFEVFGSGAKIMGFLNDFDALVKKHRSIFHAEVYEYLKKNPKVDMNKLYEFTDRVCELDYSYRVGFAFDPVLFFELGWDFEVLNSRLNRFLSEVGDEAAGDIAFHVTDVLQVFGENLDEFFKRRKRLDFLKKDFSGESDFFEIERVELITKNPDLDFEGFEKFVNQMKMFGEKSKEVFDTEYDLFNEEYVNPEARLRAMVQLFRVTSDVLVAKKMFPVLPGLKEDDHESLTKLANLELNFNGDIVEEDWVYSFLLNPDFEIKDVAERIEMLSILSEAGLPYQYLFVYGVIDMATIAEFKKYVSFAKFFNDKGVKFEAVLNLWEVTHDQSQAAALYEEFKDECPSVEFMKAFSSRFSAEEMKYLLKISYNPAVVEKFLKFAEESGFTVFGYDFTDRYVQDRVQSLIMGLEMSEGSEAKRAFFAHILRKTGALNMRVGSHIGPNNVELFFRDPALPFCEAIFKFTRDADLSLKIGRNMFLSGAKVEDMQSIDEDFVAKKKEEMLDFMLSEKAENHIYRGRNIVYLYNGEKWTAENPEFVGKSRFYSEDRMGDYRKAGAGFQSFGPENNSVSKETLDKIKSDFLAALVNTPPPMTFVFNGHGAPDTLWLTERFAVTVDEIASAIAERNKHFKDDPVLHAKLSNDIFIFNSCFNHTFIRSMYEKVASLSGIVPIALGGSEYGLFGYSPYHEKDSMEYTVFGLGSDDDRIADAIARESKYRMSDFTMYAPDATGIPQQRADNSATSKENVKPKV